MGINIENCILATILLSSEYGINSSQIFELNPLVFSSKYRESVAKKINQESKREYSFLNILLEEKTNGTVYEYEWLDILAQTPVTMDIAKKLHGFLVKKYKQNIARGY